MMKADPAAQKSLLEVQALDTRIRQLKHSLTRLPQIGPLAEISTERRVLSDRIVAAETRLSDAQRALAKAESDVEQVDKRIAKDTALVEGGSLAAKQIQDLQHELESLARRKSDLEDVELQLMEQTDACDKEAQELRARGVALEAQDLELGKERDAAAAEIQGALSEVARSLESRRAGIPEDLLALYDKVVQDTPVAAAHLQQRRCGGCNIELNASEMQSIRDAEADEVMRCDNCRAILVRTEESGI